MKKKFWFVLGLWMLALAYAPKAVAQTADQESAIRVSSDIQREKQEFLYGFYTAYMGSVIYNLREVETLLKKKYVARAVIRRSKEADVLLDAQDCIVENLHTLRVTPINDNWYRVSFLWPSPYPAVPTRRHILALKVVSSKKAFKIVDVKVEN